jgi:CysZ protein
MGNRVILGAFFAALAQLTDRRFTGVLALGVGLTIALLAGFSYLFIAVIGWVLPDTVSLPWIGEITWISTAVGWASIPVTLWLSVILMIPVASAFTGIFLDRIANAVEDRHYPNLPPARQMGLVEGLSDGLKFLGVMIGVNLIALIAYVVFAPIAPLLFWGVNGVLLGREYGQMVALRRLDAQGAARFRKSNRITLFVAGILMAVPLTIPVVNLLVPILGAATFTHLYHKLSGSARRQTV